MPADPVDPDIKQAPRTPRKSKALQEALSSQIELLKEQLTKSEKNYEAEGKLATELQLEKIKWEKRIRELEGSLKEYGEANAEFQRENARLKGQITGLESGRKTQTVMQLICIIIALGLGFLAVFKK